MLFVRQGGFSGTVARMDRALWAVPLFVDYLAFVPFAEPSELLHNDSLMSTCHSLHYILRVHTHAPMRSHALRARAHTVESVGPSFDHSAFPRSGFWRKRAGRTARTWSSCRSCKT
jgi:hypothetical protein